MCKATKSQNQSSFGSPVYDNYEALHCKAINTGITPLGQKIVINLTQWGGIQYLGDIERNEI